jgi:hypothetical protein
MNESDFELPLNLSDLAIGDELADLASYFFEKCAEALAEAQRRGYQLPVIFSLSADSPQACAIFAAIRGRPLNGEGGTIPDHMLHDKPIDELGINEVLPLREASRLLRLYAGAGGQEAADFIEDDTLRQEFWLVDMVKDSIQVMAFRGSRLLCFGTTIYDGQPPLAVPASYYAAEGDCSVSMDFHDGQSVVIRGRSGRDVIRTVYLVGLIANGQLEGEDQRNQNLVRLTDDQLAALLAQRYADAPWVVAEAIRALRELSGRKKRTLMRVLRSRKGLLNLYKAVQQELTKE